jgi:hypothetical protein
VTASVVDVLIEEPPQVRPKEDVHEVPMAQIIVTSPPLTDRAAAEHWVKWQAQQQNF